MFVSHNGIIVEIQEQCLKCYHLVPITFFEGPHSKLQVSHKNSNNNNTIIADGIFLQLYCH